MNISDKKNLENQFKIIQKTKVSLFVSELSKIDSFYYIKDFIVIRLTSFKQEQLKFHSTILIIPIYINWLNRSIGSDDSRFIISYVYLLCI